jgi:organic hydroperoxide reductase OsmC/OhrA
MPHPFPHEYRVELGQVDGSLATLKGETDPPLRAGPPPQFDGPGGIWSPETLLLGAVQLCYVTTLRSLTRKHGVEFSDYASVIRGTLDKGGSGIGFTKIELEVSLTASPEHSEKLRPMFQTAKKYCIISNALKPEVTLKVSLNGSPA